MSRLVARSVLAAALMAPAFLYGADSGVGYLKAKVKPGSAAVFVNGKYEGPAKNFKKARKYSLAPGEYEITLVEPWYEEVTTKVTIAAGKTSDLVQELKPRPAAQPPFGTLRVLAPNKFTAVYLNNHYYGHADEFSNFAQGLKLNPGEYEVRLELPGGQVVSTQNVTITKGKTTVLNASK